MSMIKYLLLLIIIIIVICLITHKYEISGRGEEYIGGSTSEILNAFERLTPLTEYKKSPESPNILGTFAKPQKPSKSQKKNKKTLAQKLTDAGWKLYLKESCPWCHLQVDMFGEDKQYLNIIDCSKLEYPENKNPANVDLRECNSVWVYPTWVNENKILPGSQSFASLTDALNGKFYITTDKSKLSSTKK